MNVRFATIALGLAALAAPVFAQTSPLNIPPQIEKDLAARATNVTEVTLGKNMLNFAAKYMNGKDKNDAAAQQLIQNLDGIYVRDYEFDKPGEYSLDELEALHKSFEGPEWSTIVSDREKKTGETTYVMVKTVNGQNAGMFVFSAEPKELSIVLILGPINMDQLGELKGLGGLSSLSGVNVKTKTTSK
ncbi:MAG TPA: DUF4252 domain-containing protein [Terracidiphilus sp.]|nr:DUF4252 domain-containing protein [Terracidiphilus sp.]